MGGPGAIGCVHLSSAELPARAEGPENGGRGVVRGVRDPRPGRQAGRMVLHHQDADGGGSGLGREQGGWGQRVAWGLTGGIPAPAPLWGGSRLWMSVHSTHPSPRPQSPHLTLQTLTSLGGAASGALPFGFPAAGGQQSPFQPKWSAKGWESLRLARGHGWKPGTDGSREFLEGLVHGDVPAGLRPRPGRKTTLIP